MKLFIAFFMTVLPFIISAQSKRTFVIETGSLQISKYGDVGRGQFDPPHCEIKWIADTISVDIKATLIISNVGDRVDIYDGPRWIATRVNSIAPECQQNGWPENSNIRIKEVKK